MNKKKEKERLHDYDEIIPVCPKCGSVHPHWTLAGKANSGKNMIRCQECRHRITIDYGQLTYYSHQSKTQWDRLIEDTEKMSTVQETAQNLGVSRMTVMRMRSRLKHQTHIS